MLECALEITEAMTMDEILRESEKRTSEGHLWGISPQQYLLRDGHRKENPWRKPGEKGVLETMGRMSFKEKVLNSIKGSREVQMDEY